MQYLAINAYTSSEWDPVSFALVEMTDELKKQIVEVSQALPEMDGVRFEGKISYDVDFYTNEEELNIALTEEFPYGFDELDEDFVGKMMTPEQQIRYGDIVISKGSFRFRAWGKHTDEEYWTADVPIEFLAKAPL